VTFHTDVFALWMAGWRQYNVTGHVTRCCSTEIGSVRKTIRDSDADWSF